MSALFDCPYLGGQVELTDERERYILGKHRHILRQAGEVVRGTLLEPDMVRIDPRMPGTRLISRWYDDLEGGKYAVLAVVTDQNPIRHWIVTGYIARRIPERGVEWKK